MNIENEKKKRFTQWIISRAGDSSSENWSLMFTVFENEEN